MRYTAACRRRPRRARRSSRTPTELARDARDGGDDRRGGGRDARRARHRGMALRRRRGTVRDVAHRLVRRPRITWPRRTRVPPEDDVAGSNPADAGLENGDAVMRRTARARAALHAVAGTITGAAATTAASSAMLPACRVEVLVKIGATMSPTQRCAVLSCSCSRRSWPRSEIDETRERGGEGTRRSEKGEEVCSRRKNTEIL